MLARLSIGPGYPIARLSSLIPACAHRGAERNHMFDRFWRPAVIAVLVLALLGGAVFGAAYAHTSGEDVALSLIAQGKYQMSLDFTDWLAGRTLTRI